MTLLSGRICKLAALAVMMLGCLTPAQAESNYTTNGTEFSIIGQLPGDQVKPDIALSTNGGMVVWQDNATDGSGWGVSACRVDGTLSGAFSPFRVNTQGSNDQHNAKVSLLKNGGTAFVWQGGKDGAQHIYARFLSSKYTWVNSSDVAVSAFNTSFQVTPSLAVLNNGNVVVVWSSFNQASTNSLMDVYAKILSPSGGTVKAEFLVNQFTSFNQRSPQVVALSSGGFAVTWVSEQQRMILTSSGTNGTSVSYGPVVNSSVDIYARVFGATGTAGGNEFIVNSGFQPCANPAIVAGSDGKFLVAWSGRDLDVYTNGWDVYARPCTTNGVGGSVLLVNQAIYGNQYAPRLAAIGTDFLCVWTSLGQDGSREGVYGRFLRGDGTPFSSEFIVNTTKMGQQIQPCVASDGSSQFAVVWSSFIGEPYNFDLFAQRYVNVDSILAPMPAPFVSAPFVLNNNVYQPQLQVSWSPLSGITVSNYEVYVDGAAVPFVTASNIWTMTAANGLTTNSTHSFQLAYVKPDGKRPPLSGATSGTTWSGSHWYGIPLEWMQSYYGGDLSQWPASDKAASILPVFLSGGNPLDPSTWLTTKLANTKQGVYLSWNCQPGFTYQVQSTTDFSNWTNLGSPRFAAGTNDSIYLGVGSVGFYRVLLVR